MEKISAVYKIVNTVTGGCYVGSSKNVMERWAYHKRPSTWWRYLNSPLYKDMQKYGLESFRFQILAPVEPEHLKEVEQELIEMIQPVYNNNRAKGLDVERYMEYHRKYNQSDKGKERIKKYAQSNRGKEIKRKSRRKYYNQLCSYNGETLTLNALSTRFRKAGIEHPTLEAKKYILEEQ